MFEQILPGNIKVKKGLVWWLGMGHKDGDDLTAKESAASQQQSLYPCHG